MLRRDDLRDERGRPSTDADYVFVICDELEIGPDFITALFAILNPRLVMKDGRVLVPAVGALRRYDELVARGTPPHEAQIWANTVFATELFGSRNEKVGAIVATGLARAWQAALVDQFPDADQVVSVEEDPDTGEIAVSLGAVF